MNKIIIDKLETQKKPEKFNWKKLHKDIDYALARYIIEKKKMPNKLIDLLEYIDEKEKKDA